MMVTLALVAFAAAAPPAVLADRAVRVADGVWFQRHHDVGALGSNVAWIEFQDFVAVIDTAFPAGAERALASIKRTTRGKRIRYAILTHYHGDHAFGTGLFAREGATIVAHENARRDLETRGAADYPGRAKTDKAAARVPLHLPDVTFTDRMVIDDGKRRAELFHFGQAHTTGCIFTWLPREKIVFTGDAAVNGPYNYLGDSDTRSWIDVLGQVQALGPEIVVPGHGALGKADVLASQRQYFVELRGAIAPLVAQGQSLAAVQAAVDLPAWKRWTGETKMKPQNIAHVYGELARGPVAATVARAAQSTAIAVPMEPGNARPKLKYLTGPLGADEVRAIADIAPNVELVVARTPREALAVAGDVQAAAGGLVTPELLRVAKGLRWIQQFSAGVEQLIALPDLVSNQQLVLTNMKAMFGPPIADHAFALLLALTRALPASLELQRSARWGKGEAGRMVELQGKTMLVVGLGGIGREVARRAHGFGMRVMATDATVRVAPVHVARLETPERLRALLPEADVVVVAVPLTDRTRNLFGAAELASMKSTAYFINIARGKEQDNLALAKALAAGKLAGAGLDVTDPEPLPPDHPLWKAPNVVITPHIAGRSPGTNARTRALFLENMRRFASGEPLLNVVDKRAGY